MPSANLFKKLSGEPNNLYCNKHSRWFSCTLKFQNHFPRLNECLITLPVFHLLHLWLLQNSAFLPDDTVMCTDFLSSLSYDKLFKMWDTFILAFPLVSIKVFCIRCSPKCMFTCVNLFSYNREKWECSLAFTTPVDVCFFLTEI